MAKLAALKTVLQDRFPSLEAVREQAPESNEFAGEVEDHKLYEFLNLMPVRLRHASRVPPCRRPSRCRLAVRAQLLLVTILMVYGDQTAGGSVRYASWLLAVAAVIAHAGGAAQAAAFLVNAGYTGRTKQLFKTREYQHWYNDQLTFRIFWHCNKILNLPLARFDALFGHLDITQAQFRGMMPHIRRWVHRPSLPRVPHVYRSAAAVSGVQVRADRAQNRQGDRGARRPDRGGSHPRAGGLALVRPLGPHWHAPAPKRACRTEGRRIAT